MKIVAVIPARGGSKGVPGKNIKLLGGKPLLNYTAELALSSKLIDQVILSTDSEEIASVGRSAGIEVPFIRPSHLAEDATPTLPVIQHALDFLLKRGDQVDAVCLLEVTSPFRTIEFLEAAIQKFINSGADSLVSVLPVPPTYNPHWVFEPNENDYLKIATGEEEIIPQRQALPKAYHRDGSIYLTKAAIVSGGSLYGKSMTYLENDPRATVNIDTMEDWEEAENLLSQNNASS